MVIVFVNVFKPVMHYTHLSKLFTLEGTIIAAMVLILTLIICRPRKAQASPLLPAMPSQNPHSASWTVSFTDVRPPCEMRGALEREHMAPFEAVMKDSRLEYHGASKCNTLPCTFRLVFDAAGEQTNDYTLHIQMSWAHLPVAAHDSYRRSSASWLALWCRDLTIRPPRSPEPPNAGYQARVEDALKEEIQIADIPAIQRTILSALKNGATFSTSHKEGGTNIGYSNGRFYRRDYGEWTSNETFTDEAAFLTFLRKFYDWETSRSIAPAKVTDEIAWRLILRLLKHR